MKRQNLIQLFPAGCSNCRNETFMNIKVRKGLTKGQTNAKETFKKKKEFFSIVIQLLAFC